MALKCHPVEKCDIFEMPKSTVQCTLYSVHCTVYKIRIVTLCPIIFYVKEFFRNMSFNKLYIGPRKGVLYFSIARDINIKNINLS